MRSTGWCSKPFDIDDLRPHDHPMEEENPKKQGRIIR